MAESGHNGSVPMTASIAHLDAQRQLPLLVIRFGLSYVIARLIQTRQAFQNVLILICLEILIHWQSVTTEVFSYVSTSLWKFYGLSVVLLLGIYINGMSTPVSSPTNSDKSTFLKPKLFPARTTHTRFFPTKHSFGYSYLLVGVPIGWYGNAGSLISTVKSSWFTIHAEDYLQRGSHKSGLAGKLETYLTSINIQSNRFTYAYLVTAPQFLGYSFNPVSFWYLYNESEKLIAMILEVNNTFDERRMYYMEKSNDDQKFINNWQKDFHVSPFNDRNGYYTLEAKDQVDGIDNIINLKSEDDKTKVVARVFSTDTPLDPELMTLGGKIQFVLGWWWVGFMTSPRILREAWKLWMKKLQVFYRPEIMVTSIGRTETFEETALEPCFRRFLEKGCCSSGKIIDYIPAAGIGRDTSILLGKLPGKSSLSLKVLTPAFYSELVRHSTITGMMDNFCQEALPGQAMLHTSEPSMLRSILDSVQLTEASDPPSWKLRMVAVLRSRNLTNIVASDSYRGQSDFDQYMRVGTTEQELSKYLNLCLKILIMDNIALGVPQLLRLYVHLVSISLFICTAFVLQTGSDSELSAPRELRGQLVAAILHLWTSTSYS